MSAYIAHVSPTKKKWGQARPRERMIPIGCSIPPRIRAGRGRRKWVAVLDTNLPDPATATCNGAEAVCTVLNTEPSGRDVVAAVGSRARRLVPAVGVFDRVKKELCAVISINGIEKSTYDTDGVPGKH